MHYYKCIILNLKSQEKFVFFSIKNKKPQLNHIYASQLLKYASPVIKAN